GAQDYFASRNHITVSQSNSPDRCTAEVNAHHLAVRHNSKVVSIEDWINVCIPRVDSPALGQIERKRTDPHGTGCVVIFDRLQTRSNQRVGSRCRELRLMRTLATRYWNRPTCAVIIRAPEINIGLERDEVLQEICKAPTLVPCIRPSVV